MPAMPMTGKLRDKKKRKQEIGNRQQAKGKSKKGKGKDNLTTIFYSNKVKRLYIFFFYDSMC